MWIQNLGLSENVVYPIVPNGFADHYPYEKWLFHWEFTLFSDKQIIIYMAIIGNIPFFPYENIIIPIFIGF